MEFNAEFLLFSSLETSIYRLTVQMRVWLDKDWAPSGRDMTSVRTNNCASEILKILLNIFPEMSSVRMVVPCHPDGHTSAASNFHIEASHVLTRTFRMVSSLKNSAFRMESNRNFLLLSLLSRMEL
jgi:hypothetical protein